MTRMTEHALSFAQRPSLFGRQRTVMRVDLRVFESASSPKGDHEEGHPIGYRRAGGHRTARGLWPCLDQCGIWRFDTIGINGDVFATGSGDYGWRTDEE